MKTEEASHRIDSRIEDMKGWVILAWQFPDSDDSITRENDRLNCRSRVDTTSVDSSPKSIKKEVLVMFMTNDGTLEPIKVHIESLLNHLTVLLSCGGL
jgi:hypothetical protein